MASADEWREVRDAIVASTGGTRSSHETRLYELAIQDGTRALSELSADDARDLVHDVLAARLEEVMDAESPRALFLIILKRRAIDRARRRKYERLAEDPTDGVHSDASSSADQVEAQELTQMMETLSSPRDFRVIWARRVLGLSSQEVADAERLTVANVDQIVHRATSRLRRLLDADPE